MTDSISSDTPDRFQRAEGFEECPEIYSRAAGSRSAFTLLELMTVMVIIAILAVMLLPAVGTVKTRAAKVQCISNLRNLYVGANAYVQQNVQWPQISTSLAGSSQYDEQWIEILLPLGVPRSCWVCPVTQGLLGNPDINNPQSPRADYIATPFDNKPMTPYTWSRMPWFSEKGNVHGNGNLIIFTDGSIQELNDVLQSAGGS